MDHVSQHPAVKAEIAADTSSLGLSTWAHVEPERASLRAKSAGRASSPIVRGCRARGDLALNSVVKHPDTHAMFALPAL